MKMQVNIEKIKVAQPYISALAIVALLALIIFSIYFGQNNKLWIILLSGVLIMAVLAEATNISNTERVVIRRGKQLMDVNSNP